MMSLSLLSGFIPSLIICSFPCLLEAQIRLKSSANLSSSWTNNNVSRPIILLKSIPKPELTQNRTQLSESMIGFACGFHEQSGGFAFVVGLAMESKNLTSGKQSLFLGNVMWIANRNRPVAENATLNLLPSGNLVLRDADGAFVWSTNTTNMSVVGMKVMKTGNLVLYDNNNKTVWQSFSHPGDILLPGQKLFPGQSLVASVSKTNTSEGSFYLSLTTEAVVASYRASLPQTFFQLSIPGELRRMELSYNWSSSNTNLSINISTASKSDVVLRSPILYSSTAYVRFDPDGHLRIYSKMDQSYDVFANIIANECNSQTCCANRGLCASGQCPCPDGFGLSDNSLPNDQGTYECAATNSTTCGNQQSQSLLPLPDIYYFNYNDLNSELLLREMDLEKCKRAFMENCSFTVAVFRQLNSSSHGDCFLLSSQFVSFRCEQETESNYRTSAFIKNYSNGSGGARRGISKSTVVITTGSIGAFLLICLFVCVSMMLLRKTKGVGVIGIGDSQVGQLSGMPRRFGYNELNSATGNFKIKLGEGGFGTVFKGSLENGENIAVKRLDDNVGQGERQFLAEVKTIGSIHHVNLVRLIGFCADNSHKLLVYEFMCNGSLDKWIFNKKEELIRPPLNWQNRKGIIQDIAKGLSYLHEECRKRIVHLDIKPQNILLDHNLHAKISDFGMSTLVDRDQPHVITTMRGTPGYLAPEWKSAIITEKVDVYSFGILVMEVTCGRKNLDRSQPEESRQLLKIFMQKAKDDQLIDLVDKDSDDMQLHALDVVGIMKLAVWCLQVDFKKRPSMSMAVRVLEGTMKVEADLDYRIYPRIEREVGEEAEHTTTVLVPSLLSGPR